MNRQNKASRAIKEPQLQKIYFDKNEVGIKHLMNNEICPLAFFECFVRSDFRKFVHLQEVISGISVGEVK